MNEVISTPRVGGAISGGRVQLNPYPTEEGLGPLLEELRARPEASETEDTDTDHGHVSR